MMIKKQPPNQSPFVLFPKEDSFQTLRQTLLDALDVIALDRALVPNMK